MRRRLGLVAFLLALLPVVPAQAATKGIGLTPAIQELSLAAEQPTVEFRISLSNTTDAAVELELSVLDFGALDESGGIAFLGLTGQEAASRGLKQWMRPELDRVSLAPGTSVEVPVTIRNDASLSPGGHYGAVIVSSASSDPGADSVAVVPAASTLVLLKKTGGEQFGLELEDIKTNSSLINLPKQASLLLKNTGNIHVVPRGTLELVSPLGGVVARGVINEASAFVLPNSSREMRVQLTSYKQPWLPGRYTLTTTWRYDGTDHTTTQIHHFWYAGKLAIYFVIFLSALIVLVMYIRYRRRPLTRNI